MIFLETIGACSVKVFIKLGCDVRLILAENDVSCFQLIKNWIFADFQVVVSDSYLKIFLLACA